MPGSRGADEGSGDAAELAPVMVEPETRVLG
jgi:hypothetical protein